MVLFISLPTRTKICFAHEIMLPLVSYIELWLIGSSVERPEPDQWSGRPGVPMFAQNWHHHRKNIVNDVQVSRALPHSHPWIVNLHFRSGRDSSRCSGVIVPRRGWSHHSDLVLTAAHCVCMCATIFCYCDNVRTKFAEKTLPKFSTGEACELTWRRPTWKSGPSTRVWSTWRA